MKKLIVMAIFAIAAAAIVPAQKANTLEPQLPLGCEELRVPDGNEVAFRVYASGVQVYWWNGSSWGFVGPIATLYANAGMTGKVGVHYGGPTWKSNSGSLVIGKNPIRCTPDPDSIPWLRLEADETDGGVVPQVHSRRHFHADGAGVGATRREQEQRDAEHRSGFHRENLRGESLRRIDAGPAAVQVCCDEPAAAARGTTRLPDRFGTGTPMRG